MNPVVSRKWAGFLLMTLVLGSFFSPYTLFFEKEIAQAEDPCRIQDQKVPGICTQELTSNGGHFFAPTVEDVQKNMETCTMLSLQLRQVSN